MLKSLFISFLAFTFVGCKTAQKSSLADSGAINGKTCKLAVDESSKNHRLGEWVRLFSDNLDVLAKASLAAEIIGRKNKLSEAEISRLIEDLFKGVEGIKGDPLKVQAYLAKQVSDKAGLDFQVKIGEIEVAELRILAASDSEAFKTRVQELAAAHQGARMEQAANMGCKNCGLDKLAEFELDIVKKVVAESFSNLKGDALPAFNILKNLVAIGESIDPEKFSASQSGAIKANINKINSSLDDIKDAELKGVMQSHLREIVATADLVADLKKANTKGFLKGVADAGVADFFRAKMSSLTLELAKAVKNTNQVKAIAGHQKVRLIAGVDPVFKAEVSKSNFKGLDAKRMGDITRTNNVKYRKFENTKSLEQSKRKVELANKIRN